jgi:dolichol-phosphate mannosyltransferase
MASSKETLPIASIVIATYNEAGSIGSMIETLFNTIFPTIKDWHCTVIVVDDTSPDKTYEIVQKYQKNYPDLHLIINPEKKGMGNAVVKGFKYAMEKLNATVVCEFDADFQHPPKDIPLLLEKINQGYDFVIGSRKIKGGSVPTSWNFKRKFFTYVGGFTSRFVLFFPFRPFFQVTDPTTGLRASRVKGFVDQIDLDNLYSLKFGYKIELLYRMIQLKAKFTEIPLQFGLRETGVSKISKDTARDILLVSLKCRRNDEFTKKFIKFGLVGGVGFIINLIGLNVFSRFLTPVIPATGLRNSIANTLASELSIISNFTFNNAWTFKSQRITAVTEIISKFFAFNFSSLVGGVLVPALIVGAGTHYFGDQTKNLFLVLAIFGFTIPYNWTVYNRVIWKKK